MNTGAWTDGPPLKIARTDATACMIDSDQVYIFGGQNPAVPGGVRNNQLNISFNFDYFISRFSTLFNSLTSMLDSGQYSQFQCHWH